MRRAVAILLAALAAGALILGCGGKFKLPTESRVDRTIPSDQSYQMLATWTFPAGDTVRDILLTQGTGTQLFILFNHPGAGTAPRGKVLSYSRAGQTGMRTPIPGITFASVFNPAALASGGDGAGSANNRVFVLDQGDSCLARANPTTGMCGDPTGGFNFNVVRPELYWRVREFRLLGGDTLSSFSDTSMAWVSGVAADDQGRVYVSGLWIQRQNALGAPDRQFLWRIFRYERGLRYPTVDKGDPELGGSKAWHRDTTWLVEDGNGTGSVLDPRGIYWTATEGGGIFVADTRKNAVQRLSDAMSSFGLYRLDGSQSDLLFVEPLDVCADLEGFLYIADTGNRRVMRYGPDASYVQRVDVERDAYGDSLALPVTVAADDSLVYIGDAGRSRVIRYKRRQ